MLYKPGLQLFMEGWLSRHKYKANRDDKIPVMSITINAIESCMDIPDCMKAEEIWLATLDDKHLILLSTMYCMAGHQQKLKCRRSCHTGHSETKLPSLIEALRKGEEQ